MNTPKLRLRLWSKLPEDPDLELTRQRNRDRIEQRKKEMAEHHILHPGNTMKLINLKESNHEA